LRWSKEILPYELWTSEYTRRHRSAGGGDPNPSVTKNWDKKLPNTLRFTVLTDFGGAAVRDNETGLAWAKVPTE